MEKITFEDATLIEQAYVEIDGVKHYVVPEQVSGGTDLNADTFNELQINIEKEFNNLKGTILWINTNPEDEFGSQNVNLNSNDYDVLEIWFRTALSDEYVKTAKCYKGIGTMLDYVMPNNARVGGRQVIYVDDTTLGFVDAYYNGTLNNTACIPLYIIGYKTGLFS